MPAALISELLFSSEFASALIGGSFTLAGVRWTYHLQAKHERKKELDAILKQIDLLLTEINVCWGIYNDEIGRTLKEHDESKPFWEKLPIGNNIFVFFDSAPECLTSIELSSAQKAFKWYTRAKGFIELINLNNNAIEQALIYARTKTSELPESTPGPLGFPVFGSIKTAQHFQLHLKYYAEKHGMPGYSFALKSMHTEMEILTAELSTDLSHEKQKLLMLKQ